MIKNESIDRLLGAIDIVQVIESYIPLRRSGANFMGVCPFHDDKNPSMSVSPSKQIFHCFACKTGGNAIKFVQEYEKLNFPQAVEKLASMYNFTLEYDENGKNSQPQQSKKILEILDAYYQSLLYSNNEALQYLYSRGLDDNLIKNFGLGWAPNSANTMRVLQNEGIENSEALAVGAIKQNEKGFYASFIDRITFPIHNHTGKLVGFGGRTLSKKQDIAKYVNSPTCAVFDKSRLFYAYDLAKRAAATKKELIICEGYMDTIMLHKAGFNNAVAVLGTALTELHLPLLNRGDFRVILSFDGDNAGIMAALRSAKLLIQNKIDSNVAIIKGEKDPADMIMAGKTADLAKIYENGIESGEFVIRQIAGNFDLSRPALKLSALKEIQNFTFSLDPLISATYESLVAEILKIPPGSFSLKNGNFRSQTKNFSERNFTPNNQKISTKDINELQILKTMLLDNNFLRLGFNFCNDEDFFYHSQIFKMLKTENENEEQKAILRELALDESVKEILDETKFQKSAIVLKIRNLEREISALLTSNFDDKLAKIQHLREQIKKLKQKI